MTTALNNISWTEGCLDVRVLLKGNLEFAMEMAVAKAARHVIIDHEGIGIRVAHLSTGGATRCV